MELVDPELCIQSPTGGDACRTHQRTSRPRLRARRFRGVGESSRSRAGSDAVEEPTMTAMSDTAGSASSQHHDHLLLIAA